MERNRLFMKKYGSGIDYSSISNVEQLHAARERLRNMIDLKELELESDVNAFKQAINPVTYINRLVSKLYSFEYLVKYFVQGYDFVRNWFNGRGSGYAGNSEAEGRTAAGRADGVGGAEGVGDGAGEENGMKE